MHKIFKPIEIIGGMDLNEILIRYVDMQERLCLKFEVSKSKIAATETF